MDPVSQGTVGAAFAQGVSNKRSIVKVSVVGFLAGLAPDLDVLIRSSTDPVLFLEYHRQFTHSLFFIPFGALLVAFSSFLSSKLPSTLRPPILPAYWGMPRMGCSTPAPHMAHCFFGRSQMSG
jgi:membrane-bound metal-dependent hydrolase YbcI (DUF457 family)